VGIWDNLNTLKVGAGSNPEDINRQTKDVHLQKSNKAELEDIVLINDATMRSGGAPIPDSGSVENTEVSDSTKTTIIRPSPGELLQVMGIDAVRSGGSGAVTYSLYLTGESDSVYWYYYSTTDSNVILSGDSNYFAAPLYLTENLYLEAVSTGTFDTVDYNVASVKVC